MLFCLYLHSRKRSKALAQAIKGHQRESSSVGRARPCQGRGREFESRLSLKSLLIKGFIFKGYPDDSGLNTCSDGGTGRHAGLKILFP